MTTKTSWWWYPHPPLVLGGHTWNSRETFAAAPEDKLYDNMGFPPLQKTACLLNHPKHLQRQSNLILIWLNHQFDALHFLFRLQFKLLPRSLLLHSKVTLEISLIKTLSASIDTWRRRCNGLIRHLSINLKHHIGELEHRIALDLCKEIIKSQGNHKTSCLNMIWSSSMIKSWSLQPYIFLLSVWDGTGWNFVVLGQYGAALVGTWW